VFLLLLAVAVWAADAPKRKPAAPPRKAVPPVADETLPWPAHVQDFPALATDARGQVWMAVVERPVPRRHVGVYRVQDGKPVAVCALEPDGLTGLGPPAIAPGGAGCVVAFPVERNDRWEIVVAFVDGDAPKSPVCRSVQAEGTANISPAVAVSGGRAWVVWESNAGQCRGIYACRVGPDGAEKAERLSAADANGYNPAVVALEDGSLMAAWDSGRRQGADLYGAWRRNGRWEAERRLTADPRIERHPALAAWKGQVWMAWQAQSYAGIRINYAAEQRIVVARVDGDGPLAPKGLGQAVLAHKGLLLRPRIAFDPAGRLWLTVRESLGPQAGWQPLAWCYSGGEWSGPQALTGQQGRWRPVTMAWTADGGLAAIQFDDLPTGWNQQGIRDDWRSGVALLALPDDKAPAARPVETEPLAMPATDFSLAEKMDLCSAALPRQQMSRGGQRLMLFWGDFHDHTDLSVCQRSANPPGHDLLANERDIERLDFCSLNDHGYNFDWPQWQFNGEQTRANHDPGRFVTFLAEEWTSDHIPYSPPRYAKPINSDTPVELRRYGHHNLIFRDPYYPRFFDSRDGDITPRQVWEQFAPGDILVIPHQLADLGNRPTDWSFHDERFQPVAEIFQTRGSYEYLGAPRQAPRSMAEPGHYLQDAWAKGLVIGVIASPDHGGGSGKVGAWAEDLTRDGIFRAIRARHTFGTSGAKMGLYVAAGEAMMGDKVKRPPGPILFHVRAAALRDIKELVIFRNNQVVHRAEPGKKDIDLDWTDLQPPDAPVLWYYVRIHAVDDELAWSSPIWFER
jgi:hypothetical protein